MRNVLNLMYLQQYFINRAEQIFGLIWALSSGENVFFYGPPGTAKSALARAFVHSIAGAKYFEYLLTPSTLPDEIFGPLDIKAFRQGVYQRVITGRLPDANIAFLDEIWNADSYILNGLLTIINEKIFHDRVPIPVELDCVIAASNSIPTDSVLAAMYDRFMLRYTFEEVPIQELLTAPELELEVVAHLNDFRAVRQQARKVHMPPQVFEAFVKIISTVRSRNIKVSDRRVRKLAEMLKVAATLDGRDEVTLVDLELSRYALWQKPGELPQVTELVIGITDPEFLDLSKKYEEILAKAREVQSLSQQSGNAEAAVQLIAKVNEVKAAVNRLIKQLNKRSRQSARVARIVERLGEIQKSLPKLNDDEEEE